MLHALFIDDDDDFLAGLTEIAEQEGFAVATVGTLEAARDHLSRERVDVAVVDLVLPDGKGTALLEELRDTTTDAIIV
jgi:DNA-binding response OmpR family regulator